MNYLLWKKLVQSGNRIYIAKPCNLFNAKYILIAGVNEDTITLFALGNADQYYWENYF